ncbi:MAG: MraY family glycosyltransferase, partial [Candidatus Omnitrophota bacterium]
MKNLTFFLISLGLSLIFTPLVRGFALKKGLVSYPRYDRWHKHPTALLGGVGIYLAFIISLLLLKNFDKNVLAVLLGGTLLFIVGLIDDKFKITPYSKLFAQIIAGCIAISLGVIAGLPLGVIFAIPLTLLWIVAITNSFNLLDNIDGLAAGIAAISALMLFVSSLVYSNNPLS